ncbi:MAG: hypothetical protein GEV28_31115 [Actinophytocola sp.]|uniref:hypothetical protein n=1 Tax=Actinophytocola sp. TaxID=1872138 RepID=UPI0013265A46|nr:hypothetical protein [Actinophytocola sp.]MPZ84597.1 hypothetical protein [Actinophytocola sp.]
MRNWRATFKALTSSPRGWSADGRTLGLGLATAMAKQRQDAPRGVEDYLRTAPAERVRASV